MNHRAKMYRLVKQFEKACRYEEIKGSLHPDSRVDGEFYREARKQLYDFIKLVGERWIK